MGKAWEDIDMVIGDERPRVWRYSHSAGPIRSRFLLQLRDNQKIMGSRCPACGKVYVPARSTCLPCFENMEDLVEVGHEGVLETYTFSNDAALDAASDTPAAFGIIKLDGADTGLVHRLGEVDHTGIKIGMRVEAVFADSLKGDIRDIKYFRPV